MRLKKRERNHTSFRELQKRSAHTICNYSFHSFGPASIQPGKTTNSPNLVYIIFLHVLQLRTKIIIGLWIKHLRAYTISWTASSQHTINASARHLIQKEKSCALAGHLSLGWPDSLYNTLTNPAFWLWGAQLAASTLSRKRILCRVGFEMRDRPAGEERQRTRSSVRRVCYFSVRVEMRAQQSRVMHPDAHMRARHNTEKRQRREPRLPL